jgi:hypothetical protein
LAIAGGDPHVCVATSQAPPFTQGNPSAQPARQVRLVGSQYVPPGHDALAQLGAAGMHDPLAQLAPDGQSALVAHPAWQEAEPELQW